MRVASFITAFAVGVAAAPIGPDLSAATGPLNMVLKEAQKQVPPTVNKLNSAVAPSQKDQQKAKSSPAPSPSPSPASKKATPSPSPSSSPSAKPKPSLPPKPKSDPLSAVTGVLGGLGAREVEPAKIQSINDIADAETLSDITGKLNKRVDDLAGAVDEVPVEKIAGLTDKLGKDKLTKVKRAGFENPFQESVEGAAIDAMAEDGDVKKQDIEARAGGGLEMVTGLLSGLTRRATSSGGAGIDGILMGITNGLGSKKARSPVGKRDNEPRSPAGAGGLGGGLGGLTGLLKGLAGRDLNANQARSPAGAGGLGGGLGGLTGLLKGLTGRGTNVYEARAFQD